MWCHNKYQTGISQVCNLYSLAILRVSFTTAKLGIDSCLSASRSPSGDMLIHRRCWYDEYPLPLDTWRADIYEEGGVPGSTMTQTFQHFPSGVRKCTSEPHDNPEIYTTFILNSTRNLHLHQHAYLQLGKLSIFVARWGTIKPTFCALVWLT